MPVQEFNEHEVDRENPETGEPLTNYWGYNPVAFLAPESRYCSHGTAGQQVPAFKEMMKALHQAGIEVIVDIVLNHTAEGNHRGPTLCLRGIDNVVYYVPDEDQRRYRDFTGTGNTIRADHPVVRDFILETLRQVKNFVLTLFISRGVPMLLGGDQMRRTQEGNNNAYCQDNEISWFDWTQLETASEIHRFVQGMIAFRQGHPVLCMPAYYRDDEMRWLGPDGSSPDWGDADLRQLGWLILDEGEGDLLLIFNAGTAGVVFALPEPANGGMWHLVADTAAPSPEDLFAAGEETPLDGQDAYEMAPRSSAILVAKG